MSRQYTILRQATIGSKFEALNDALAELQRKQPKSADALRRMDWAAVRAQVAREAIARVATKHGATQQPSHGTVSWRTDGGATPKGECVGVIVTGDAKVALFLNADRIELAWTEAHYAHDMQLATAERAAKRAAVPKEVTQLREEVQRAFDERAEVVARRIGFAAPTTETRTIEPDGTVVITIVKQTAKGGA